MKNQTGILRGKQAQTHSLMKLQCTIIKIKKMGVFRELLYVFTVLAENMLQILQNVTAGAARRNETIPLITL